ncbi:Cytosol aminopeptidase [Defluviimonas aquaemixtae]|uniref:Probable cytosol aminopeptidase n=1 Tax=Albidovulum aquaemixtae TaxID=1542388 RepID=A0A2R8B690_9RHOB|nr:leucyl aminopeptidase [Defluviimonas aquaemixtae]SPH18053.1 Cytosol aminopeptidase [Defluviimonas aquaemixtae]
MTTTVPIQFRPAEFETLKEAGGRIALILAPDARPGAFARRLDRLMRGAISRAMEGKAWTKLKSGEAMELAYPAGLEAEAVQLVKLPKKVSVTEARKAGGAIGKALGENGVTVMAAGHGRTTDIVLGAVLRAYDFRRHRTSEGNGKGAITILTAKVEALEAEWAAYAAVAEGIAFTRDLVNEPANVLTTTDFADRLAAMNEIGLKVEVLEEKELEKLGMRALLGVGQGSESPSKVVVMEWQGGKKGDAPLALVGKGVVFDTGGISIKPAAGMEEMTMDMGGAGVVAGVMRAIALRKAKANVVGLVGLVENMPDGRAQRPGDIVKSMKGDTIEVINTDAEGRLVLADVLWYAQDRYKPAGLVNLATLTGAMIIALGHENAGVFSNDDALCGALLKAAEAEGEGAWRMPMGAAYDELLKSRLADMKNIGGRPAGSITAAQFLRRFVKDDVPWCHIDIAGVTLPPKETDLAPKGATGWGVMSLDRLIRDRFEGQG